MEQIAAVNICFWHRKLRAVNGDADRVALQRTVEEAIIRADEVIDIVSRLTERLATRDEEGALGTPKH